MPFIDDILAVRGFRVKVYLGFFWIPGMKAIPAITKTGIPWRICLFEKYFGLI